MEMFYVLGDAIVTRDELIEKTTLGRVRDFKQRMFATPSDARLEFSGGKLTSANALFTDRIDASGQPIKPTEVKIGRPLTVEFRTVYTGLFPRGFGNPRRDLLVTSAIRGLGVQSGMPKALNLLRSSVGRHTPVRDVDPTQPGTPCIYYSKSLIGMNSSIRVDIAFDEFPKPLFDVMSRTATGLAGVPIFAPANLFLLIAGSLLNLAGSIGESIFDSDSDYHALSAISFDRPGDFETVADFRLLMNPERWDKLKGTFFVDGRGELVDRNTRQPYRGDAPYFVLSIDGGVREEYEGFEPAALQADLAERFIGGKDVSTLAVEGARSLAVILNDAFYAEKAEDYHKRYKQLSQSQDAEEKKLAEEYKQKFEAALKNISDEKYKPKPQ